MTTIREVSRTRALCGARRKYREIGSTNSTGSQDLDLRPPQMARSTMSMWVKKCPKCGYCAPDIEKKPGVDRKFVKRSEYKAVRKDRSYPELARRFLCSAMIQEVDGKLVDAGWSALRAAWACDDKGEAQKAHGTACREKALGLLNRARADGVEGNETHGVGEAVMADMYRRIGRFDLAIATADEGQTKTEADSLVFRVLALEKRLSLAQDVSCHTVSEAE